MEESEAKEGMSPETDEADPFQTEEKQFMELD